MTQVSICRCNKTNAKKHEALKDLSPRCAWILVQMTPSHSTSAIKIYCMQSRNTNLKPEFKDSLNWGFGFARMTGFPWAQVF